jgi:thioredoxin reductase
MHSPTTPPIAIIGAGPIGLAAAAHLSERALPFVLFEAGSAVAASFASFAHVRLFSPWRMNLDDAAVRLLQRADWQSPALELLPTAGDMLTAYLKPLGRLFADRIHYSAEVEAITRRGFDKLKTAGREHAAFVLRVRTASGESEVEARAVLDASGTWSTPSWMGAGGLPALGERAWSKQIAYGMPDILGAERRRYANKRVLVVGAGHSAAGNLISLGQLALEAKETRILWGVRSRGVARALGGGSGDGLPARGQLGTALQESIDAGKIALHLGLSIESVVHRDGKLEVISYGDNGDARRLGELDEIIVATGARPDWTLARELRLRLDPCLECTDRLAPLIDPRLHGCESVPAHGHRELEHPESGFYAVGAKSYGRASSFLLATGYEQVRSVAAALAGDLTAAETRQVGASGSAGCRA